MVIDSYTKVILTAIAFASAVVAVNPWIAPRHASASYHEAIVVNIYSALKQIADGKCRNPTICKSK